MSFDELRELLHIRKINEGLTASMAAGKRSPEDITLLKDTSLISVVAGKEIVYVADAISSKTFEAMFPYLITAAMYLILVLIFSGLQGILERRLRASDRR